MEILSDILLNSKFNPDAIEVERGVILREMEEVSNMQEEVLHDILHETAFQKCGLGRTILGPEKNIKSISRSDLLEYIDTHYTSPRMVICGSGSVNHEQLCEIADRTFGGLPPIPRNGLMVPKDTGLFTPSEIRQSIDAFPLAHIALSFKGKSWTDSEAIGLMLLSTYLGAWDRSSSGVIPYLCKEIAQKELAHSVSAFNTQYKDIGLFGVNMSAEPQNIPDLCSYVIQRLKDLPDKITDEEILQHRNNLKARIVIELDGTSAICEDIGRQMLTYGRRITPAEAFARIDAVTPENFRALCRSIFVGNDLAVAALGPVDTLPDLKVLQMQAS
jgi:processing peptidase subunit beta